MPTVSPLLFIAYYLLSAVPSSGYILPFRLQFLYISPPIENQPQCVVTFVRIQLAVLVREKSRAPQSQSLSAAPLLHQSHILCKPSVYTKVPLCTKPSSAVSCIKQVPSREALFSTRAIPMPFRYSHCAWVYSNPIGGISQSMRYPMALPGLSISPCNSFPYSI